MGMRSDSSSREQLLLAMPENDEAMRNQTESRHPVFGPRIEPHRYSMLDQRDASPRNHSDGGERPGSGCCYGVSAEDTVRPCDHYPHVALITIATKGTK